MLYFFSAAAFGQQEKKALLEGFIPLEIERQAGKISLRIPQEFLEKEFLYVNSLAAGVGSNDLGLDRGQLGKTRVVAFQEAGKKLLLIEKNYGFRAYSDNPAELKAVEDAFAQSVVFGFDIAERSPDGSILVDATAFYLQDAHQVARKLTDANQGRYTVDASRSALHFPMVKNFPLNTEVESILTVSGEGKGSYIRSVSPDADHITVRQRHSFIALPDANYQPREFDPRSGYFHISYQDYSSPINSPLIKKYISRHRLEKKDPSAARSEAVKPIVYYVDRGTPEPIRSALIEGGNWWAEAFDAAGFVNAFRVELMPEGADPLDVRYHVIQWVHRATRGWSYGSSIRDPRTGEILKGHVSLGSLRVRQDFLIAQGLAQPYDAEHPDENPLLEMALARLRQLSAHEIGHTIGLAHAYASSPSNRASVMDYPYPLITLDAEGKPDFSNAYEQKIGAWDVWAIRYGYETVPEGQSESAHLKQLLEDTYADGHTFISDTDARHPSGSHPQAHLWDNGDNAAEELMRMLQIRKQKLATFSLNSIPDGTPEAQLEEVLVPLYLMHRYQLEATSKLIGGLDYTYKVKGDNQRIQARLDAATQKKALEAILASLQVEQLALPEFVLERIPPRPMGYGRNRETFPSRNGLNFDPFAPAENVLDLALGFLLESGRANRLHQQHLFEASLPSYQDVVDALSDALVARRYSATYADELQVLAEHKLVEHLERIAADPGSSPSVQAISRGKLQEIALIQTAEKKGSSETSLLALHRALIRDKVTHFLSEKMPVGRRSTLKVPDGAPIGSDEIFCDFDW
ncbi:extracellular metal-dependent peptidase [Nitritalea halalkaliphila LW7]|uniref:Extracellular metal-dependent peptidase n=2 Tax=Nitritalea TaxID=1187887 RepID=I5C2U8_9BACT|nr:extracellular metal-dependent peptidase [Nitritalea halalkaliphila LW7]